MNRKVAYILFNFTLLNTTYGVNQEITKTLETIGAIIKLRVNAQQNPSPKDVVTGEQNLYQLNTAMNNVINTYNTTTNHSLQRLIYLYFEGLTEKKRRNSRFSPSRYQKFIQQPDNEKTITQTFNTITNTWQKREKLGTQLISLFASGTPDIHTIFTTMLNDMTTFQEAAQDDDAIVEKNEIIRVESFKKKKSKSHDASVYNKNIQHKKETQEQCTKYNRMFTFWFDPALSGATSKDLSYATAQVNSDSLKEKKTEVAQLLQNINTVYKVRQQLETLSMGEITDSTVQQINNYLDQIDILYKNIRESQKDIATHVTLQGQTCLQTIVCGLLPSFIQHSSH